MIKFFWNGGILISIPNCCKNWTNCGKAIVNYFSVKQFRPDWYKAQEMYDNAFDPYPFVFDSVLDSYKT